MIGSCLAFSGKGRVTWTLCFRYLGVPLAIKKQAGPTTCLTFLGIKMDTLSNSPPHRGQAQSPPLGPAVLVEAQICRRRDLELLIGHLQHACRVIRPVRSFLQGMIDLLRPSRRPHHYIRLNCQFRADLQRWERFASCWNGIALFPPPLQVQYDVTSDASGQWGCGAWSQDSWFQFQWPEESKHHHIAFKELVAVLLACAVWGDKWRGARVKCHCDNQAAVQVITTRSCRDSSLMHLVRCLFVFEAHFRFEVVAMHIPGACNTLADDLSRNRLASLSKAPSADQVPTPVPPQLPTLLLDLSQDWALPAWTRQFTAILRRE